MLLSSAARPGLLTPEFEYKTLMTLATNPEKVAPELHFHTALDEVCRSGGYFFNVHPLDQSSAQPVDVPHLHVCEKFAFAIMHYLMHLYGKPAILQPVNL